MKLASRPAATPRANRGFDHALPLITAVCRLSGPLNYIDVIRAEFQQTGLVDAVRRHDTPALFNWLMTILSYQGIADRIVDQYLADHGNVTWTEIAAAIANRPDCPKLGGFWCFDDCRYEKLSGQCSQPAYIPTCPVPTHPLRNGRLNQTAYSLFFFIRDVANGDIVAWIDQQLIDAWASAPDNPLTAARHALVGPLRGVYGVSDKIISMALSSLLLAVGHRKRHWIDIGGSFVVIDSLVHNFLHRTGILTRCGADHAYGPACYRPGNCADLVRQFAGHIDAASFNPQFPHRFDRWVQVAIWRYCSQGGLDICNGNRVTDGDACDNIYCQLRSRCDRVPLPRPKLRAANTSADLVP
jgi:hypothetical protein